MRGTVASQSAGAAALLAVLITPDGRNLTRINNDTGMAKVLVGVRGHDQVCLLVVASREKLEALETLLKQKVALGAQMPAKAPLWYRPSEFKSKSSGSKLKAADEQEVAGLMGDMDGAVAIDLAAAEGVDLEDLDLTNFADKIFVSLEEGAAEGFTHGVLFKKHVAWADLQEKEFGIGWRRLYICDRVFQDAFGKSESEISCAWHPEVSAETPLEVFDVQRVEPEELLYLWKHTRMAWHSLINDLIEREHPGAVKRMTRCRYREGYGSSFNDRLDDFIERHPSVRKWAKGLTATAVAGSVATLIGWWRWGDVQSWFSSVPWPWSGETETETTITTLSEFQRPEPTVEGHWWQMLRHTPANDTKLSLWDMQQMAVPYENCTELGSLVVGSRTSMLDRIQDSCQGLNGYLVCHFSGDPYLARENAGSHVCYPFGLLGFERDIKRTFRGAGLVRGLRDCETYCGTVGDDVQLTAKVFRRKLMSALSDPQNHDDERETEALRALITQPFDPFISDNTYLPTLESISPLRQPICNYVFVHCDSTDTTTFSRPRTVTQIIAHNSSVSGAIRRNPDFNNDGHEVNRCINICINNLQPSINEVHGQMGPH
ncbi:hypothetical protein GNI_175180 [Gregarina niphandrodes]|uniref:Uncharacterized protein n=1 Tax=Gregarina niphandrodes TaxID=110365 RepID=A0A023AXM2_GRENI|nr:hypothetical protein GNI_175180 [Gregarina niphandrodes]EZG43374.1 hypothetical protein GNI_175180 [Gregarina niphandrodes]|eukprot:XP_011134647.1 hypothetical protein GNI_175180 [Gregarina niphandrodes]